MSRYSFIAVCLSILCGCGNDINDIDVTRSAGAEESKGLVADSNQKKDQGVVDAPECASELIAVVSDPKIAARNPKKLISAIVRLGELKAVEAAPALARILDFKGPEVEQTGEPPPVEVAYPAAKSLIQIGEPAIPAVIHAISSEKRSGTRFVSNGIYVIMQIKGGTAAGIKELNSWIPIYSDRLELLRDIAEEVTR